MTSHTTIISVVAPITPAIERVKTLLFRPFDPSRWLAIAFCAWLAWLGQGGFGGFHYGSRWDWQHVRNGFDEAKEWVLGNLHWLVPVAVVVAVFGFVLWLLVTWLSSRGRFMFLHCVARNVAEIGVPWSQFARPADSLFLFRIILGLVATVSLVPVVVVGVVSVARMIAADGPSMGGVFALLGAVSALLVLGLIFLVIHKFTTDFVVPTMFLRVATVGAGWREFLALLSVNKANFLLYLLFQIVIKLVIGVLVLAVVVVTCCIAGCLMAVPYVGTVLLLPILVFERAYSLYYLAQFGPELDVFAPLAPPAPLAPEAPTSPAL